MSARARHTQRGLAALSNIHSPGGVAHNFVPAERRCSGAVRARGRGSSAIDDPRREEEEGEIQTGGPATERRTGKVMVASHVGEEYYVRAPARPRPCPPAPLARPPARHAARRVPCFCFRTGPPTRPRRHGPEDDMAAPRGKTNGCLWRLSPCFPHGPFRAGNCGRGRGPAASWLRRSPPARGFARRCARALPRQPAVA